MAIARTDQTVAASDLSPRPKGKWLVIAAAVIAIGYVVGISLLGVTAPTGQSDLLVVSSNWSAFGALFVVALAVERFIEPFSEWLGPSTTNAAVERDEKVADSESNAADMAKTKAAAVSQDSLTRARNETAIVTWAVATALAYVTCGGLKILLLSAIVDTKVGGVPVRWMDLLVTGLVVGAGTKPLHDLVSNIQKSSASKTDAPAEAR
jgi:hypothetical protein